MKDIYKVVLEYEIKEKLTTSHLDFLEKREMYKIIEVINNKATAYFCYKDSNNKLYIKKYVEMSLIENNETIS